jgi:hypothetical protein
MRPYCNHFKDLTAAKLLSQPPSYALAKLVDATNAQWAKMARKNILYPLTPN